MEDWMIVRLLFQRSEEAVAELDRKYGKICSAIAYRILQNREDAEECVNDAFLRTLKKRERAEYSVWGCFQSGSQLVKESWKVAFFLNP